MKTLDRLSSWFMAPAGSSASKHFREEPVSIIRAVAMLVLLATLIWSGEAAAESGMRVAAWLTILAVLWAIALRVLPPGSIRHAAAIGLVGEFVATALLLYFWPLLVLPGIAFLSLRCVTVGIRYTHAAFVAALVAACAVAGISALSLSHVSAPAIVGALILLVGLPLTVNLVHRQISASSSEALQARDAQRQFMGLISHELRSPLHVVINASQLIDRSRLPADDATLMHSIEQSGKTLLNMVDDLLDVAAINAGRIELRPVYFRMAHAVERIREILEVQAKAKNVRLSWSVDTSIPVLFAPKRHIEQVISNLGINAIKYTPPGGGVHISVHHYGLDPKALAAGGGTLTLVFAVSDTGIGIPDVEKRRIFEPFRQVSQGSARAFEGVGLGLHVVNTISQKMGGTLEVQDNFGGGTIFTWHVQAQALAAAPEEQEVVPALAQLDAHRRTTRQLRCLVIDDNQSNLEIMSRLLRRAGHEPTVRSEGATGLLAMRTEVFDVAFIDLHMPGLSGWDVLRELRSDPGLDKAPIVIILSAVTDETTANTAIEQGARAYLSKPIPVDQLLALLSAVATEGRAFTAPESLAASTPPAESQLALLRKLSPDAARDFIEAVQADVAQCHAAYTEALGAQNRDQLLEQLHRLKNCCGSVGDYFGATRCQQVSDALRAGDNDWQPDAIADVFAELQTFLRSQAEPERATQS